MAKQKMDYDVEYKNEKYVALRSFHDCLREGGGYREPRYLGNGIFLVQSEKQSGAGRKKQGSRAGGEPDFDFEEAFLCVERAARRRYIQTESSFSPEWRVPVSSSPPSPKCEGDSQGGGGHLKITGPI